MPSVTFLKIFSRCSLVFLLFSLTAVVIIVWTTPDIQHVDGNSVICLEECGKVKCSETITKLKQLLDPEIQEVYKRTSELHAQQTKDYYESARNESNNDLLASVADLKPAAKLVGKRVYNESEPQTKKMKQVLSWSHDGDSNYRNGFQNYGVRYQNGRLIVPLTGTYNIYSFLSLSDDEDIPDHRETPGHISMVNHSMYRFNVELGRDEELASSIQTYRKSPVQSVYAFSTHISKLVQLQAGDEISVKISNISLTTHPGDNFFGLHMI